MSKRFTFIQSIISALLLVAGLTVFSFGQTTDLQGDLQKSFKNFNLVKFDNRAVLQRVETGQTLSISTATRSFELNLTPHDLRAARYRAENTGGGVQPRERDATVTTFKGTISGEADSRVRMSIDGAKIEGYFISGGEMFIVEQARKFSQAAGKEDYVVYRRADLINPQSITCDADVSEKIVQGSKTVAANIFQSPQTLRVIEMATEADFEFVSALGSVDAANREILNILNMVDGVYESELGLTINVVYQHTWSTPDPFSNIDSRSLLFSVRDYWNINYPVTSIPRDTVHLYSAKLNVAAQGLSFIGVVCKTPTSAYGLDGRVDFAPLKMELTAHEVAHNIGASHVDTTQSCANTLMNTILSDATLFTFCAFSRTEITNFISANGSCLSPRPVVRNKYDFDGDGKADTAVYRPSSGTWYLLNSQTGFAAVQFGISTDRIAPADFDGDGKTDIAVYRPSNGVWYLLRSTGGFTGIQFGVAEDVPVAADYDGDGRAEIAVYRPATGVWYILNLATNQVSATQFGLSEDKPVAADFDGDGRADIAVYRPSSGIWYILGSRQGYYGVQFGISTDKPAPADFDGDGKTDIAVYRPSSGVWYLLQPTGFTGIQFGISTDTPVPADYDGDGRADIAVYRPATGVWYQLQTTQGIKGLQFGISEDKTIPNSLVP